MPRRFTSKLSFVATLLLLVSTASAQFWFDNFNDESFDDGVPVTWSTNPQGALPGEYSISEGDLVMFAQDGDNDNESMAAWVDDVEFAGTASVRTRASLLNIPEVIDGFGNVGVTLFFDPETISGYLGLFSVDTNLQLISVVGGSPEGLVNMHQEFGPEDDVYIQLDHDGEMLSLTAWEIGTPKPPAQLEIEHSQFSSGRSGLIMNENSPNGAGIFRWARAQAFEIVDGDLDLDGDADAADIDTLFENLGSQNALFDVSEDGLVDQDDVQFLVNSILETELGDANLDGTVGPDDHAIWEANRFQENTGWATGDFNGDQVSDGSDFNIWNNHRARAAAVPEPATGWLALFFLALGSLIGRRS